MSRVLTVINRLQYVVPSMLVLPNIPVTAAGAILVTPDSYKRFQAPVVKKLSTVGAGDSMVAGIVWMLVQGKPLEE